MARETAAMCASLLGIAETFAQVDQRLAAIEAKLERPPNENGGRPPLDLRGMLREFVDEFRQVRGEVEAEGRASTRAPAAARPCARTLMRSHAPVGRCRYLAAL